VVSHFIFGRAIEQPNGNTRSIGCSDNAGGIVKRGGETYAFLSVSSRDAFIEASAMSRLVIRRDISTRYASRCAHRVNCVEEIFDARISMMRNTSRNGINASIARLLLPRSAYWVSASRIVRHVTETCKWHSNMLKEI